jgi:hypothetical protein
MIMREPGFKEMIGTLGSFFIGHRIFRTVLRIKRQYSLSKAEFIFNKNTTFKQDATVRKSRDHIQIPRKIPQKRYVNPRDNKNTGPVKRSASQDKSPR